MNDEAQIVSGSENDTVETAEAPGHRLRAAREAKDLTTKQIAEQLKLKRGIIDALEADDYARLPSVLFARGYLKSYARLLGLSVDEIVGAFDQQGMTEEVPVPHGAILTSKYHRRGERIVLKWGSAAVVVALIGLLVVWFQGESTDELLATLGLTSRTTSATMELASPLPAKTEETATGGEPSPETNVPMEVEGQPPTEISAVPPQTNESGLSATAINGAEATPVVTSGSENDDSVREEPAAPVTTSEETSPSLQQNEPMDSAANDEEVAGTEVTALVSANGAQASTVEISGVLDSADSDSLELTLQADSWTEVTDASGYKLIYRLLRAGDVHRITGRAPFTIFLGNAPAVEVKFNDQPVTDIRANSKGVARFTLGSS